jgi:hypothetical protein
MAAAMAQEEAETSSKGGWRQPYCRCTIVVVVIVVVVLVAGVEAAEEGMCSGCSVFDFVFFSAAHLGQHEEKAS